MREKQQVIMWLKKNRLPISIKSEESLVRYWRDGKTSWSNGLGEIEALGKLRLVEDNIEAARSIFREGIELLLVNRPINQTAHWELAYLGAGPDVARPMGQRALALFESDNTTTPKALKGMEVLRSWQCLLTSHVSGDTDRITRYMKQIETECSGIKFGENGLPASLPTHLEWGYAIFGKRMVQGLVDLDVSLFEKNLRLWSDLLLSRITKSTHPLHLVGIELIYLYDISLGKGMRPKIDTPFIPKLVIENGYWNRPS